MKIETGDAKKGEESPLLQLHPPRLVSHSLGLVSCWESPSESNDLGAGRGLCPFELRRQGF